MADYDEEALREDANGSWQPWSLQVQKWGETIDGLALDRQAFSVAPGSDELFSAFNTALSSVRTYLSEGEEVFEGIARALLDSAIEYMEMEGYAADEIARVEREMAAL
ncbi:hypothetical protein HWD99_08090 [Microbacterium sp. C5A9]|uniref:hypothetical protein n=1 Tax=Microbacterium sp. C5A9 TaxID=2736663 RepID=UPI001F5164C5|nr:hypothetical protein [Microbacterium sp. C5A9]MCI1018578.1 hypothetical protein [Microbacterium sp. C5A9]